MKKIILVALLATTIQAVAQDTAMTVSDIEKKPVQIFSSDRAVNANTNETTGKGKMAFKVMHNFGDIAGDNGGIQNFFGLDVTTDAKIGFHIGLSDRFDLIIGRAKGGIVAQLWEMGFKYQLMQQQENGNPFALAVFANAVVSSSKRNTSAGTEASFEDFGDRLSNVVQLIVARRFGNVSLQLNPTYVRRGLSLPWDKTCYFALGGAIRFPVIKNRLNIVADYFHTFRSEAVQDSFLVRQNVTMYDPLGVGFEFLTTGHIFRLNFTNANQILENRFIPRNPNSWGKGQFRWCFTISRNFTLWR